jgi:hypothetical protein
MNRQLLRCLAHHQYFFPLLKPSTMNLHFLGSSIEPTHNELSIPSEHSESVAFPILIESSDEGEEYAADGLRMADQLFGQD